MIRNVLGRICRREKQRHDSCHALFQSLKRSLMLCTSAVFTLGAGAWQLPPLDISYNVLSKAVFEADMYLSREVLFRLGNVLYWLFIVPCVVISAFFIYATVESIFSGNFFHPYTLDNVLALVIFVFGPIVISYAIGWSLRYILSGATDHPIKTSIKINNNAAEFLELLKILLINAVVYIWLAYVFYEPALWLLKMIGWQPR